MRVRILALVALLAAVLAVPAVGAAPSLSTKLTRALAGPYLPAWRTAAIAVDLETGTVLFAHNETKPVVPASNEKLPVAWTALTRLGPAYRFHTEIYGQGHRSGSVWEGDLILKGFGDPTLTTRDLGGLARKIAKLGITQVTGRVRGDESFYDRERGIASWKHGFLGIESPPLSALVVDRGLGWPALSPPLLAAKALVAELGRAGVSVAGRPGLGVAGPDAVPLASDRSYTLGTIVKFMDHESDNFTAEMILKQLGAATGRVGTTSRGARVVMQTLAEAHIPTAGLRIADGSGLSPANRVTAAAIVGILQAAWSSPILRAPFVQSLASAGTSGTMRHRLLDLRGFVRAKTGTTNLACSLSGYVGDRFAFAVIENGEPVAYWMARQAQDRFVTLLAKEARARTVVGG
jgi:D-alanyl-D-alanine carboxypeptidase/D-alanyl-D-alanine-endopeptidase (penicillin-binding protein 4)